MTPDVPVVLSVDYTRKVAQRVLAIAKRRRLLRPYHAPLGESTARQEPITGENSPTIQRSGSVSCHADPSSAMALSRCPTRNRIRSGSTIQSSPVGLRFVGATAWRRPLSFAQTVTRPANAAVLPVPPPVVCLSPRPRLRGNSSPHCLQVQKTNPFPSHHLPHPYFRLHPLPML